MHYRAPVDERLSALEKIECPPRRVTILGAGMAGLVAATELTRLGHTVRVLEATARGGGRVHTWRPEGGRYHEFDREPGSHAE
jgi:monoamine oxidase